VVFMAMRVERHGNGIGLIKWSSHHREVSQQYEGEWCIPQNNKTGPAKTASL